LGREYVGTTILIKTSGLEKIRLCTMGFATKFIGEITQL